MRLIVLIIPNQGIDPGLSKSSANSWIPCSGDHLPATIAAASDLVCPPRRVYQLPGEQAHLSVVCIVILSLPFVLPTLMSFVRRRTSPAASLRQPPRLQTTAIRLLAFSRTSEAIHLVLVRTSPLDRCYTVMFPVRHGHILQVRPVLPHVVVHLVLFINHVLG
jgi:hypothetical protein